MGLSPAPVPPAGAEAKEEPTSKQARENLARHEKQKEKRRQGRLERKRKGDEELPNASSASAPAKRGKGPSVSPARGDRRGGLRFVGPVEQHDYDPAKSVRQDGQAQQPRKVQLASKPGKPMKSPRREATAGQATPAAPAQASSAATAADAQTEKKRKKKRGKGKKGQAKKEQADA